MQESPIDCNMDRSLTVAAFFTFFNFYNNYSE